MEESKDKARCQWVIYPNYTEEELKLVMADALKGNLPAKMNLILHNQGVMNEKMEALMGAELNRLMEQKDANNDSQV